MLGGRRYELGLFLSLFALIAQIAVGASVPQAQEILVEFGTICHAGEDEGSAPAAPAHHLPDCTCCLLCTAVSVPPVTLTDGPSFPLPRLALIVPAVVLPPSTAPPAQDGQQHRPRGPPIPV
jgi:hypothetical protein